ncbi:MAG TPA: sugar phosphate isomerase/epimerase [Candidatus Bathyarchaeia archaeon]|nr:sugar phosphate isomerase/epimerase [Candidatus Bathyarchaeia archaeon]
MNRRDFLQFTAAGLGTLALSDLSFAFAGIKPFPVGVQLYTVRQQAESDLQATLAHIAMIGYNEVETYWNVYTHPADKLRKMIVDNGLTVPSGHFDYDGLATKFDYAKELGVQYMVCPMLPKDMWTSADGFKKAAAQFNKWGEQAKSMGMQFGFHNHNYEFQKFGNQTGFDILTTEADPKLVCLEMDCYWITQSGNDPVAMLKKYGNRIQLVHLKDRKAGFPTTQMLAPDAEHFTEVGSGTINWKAVIETAQQTGVKHFFVERDNGDLPPFESLRVSYDYLSKLMKNG